MLGSYLQKRIAYPSLVRLAASVGFAALTALSARVTLDLQPVPITLQVLVVLLAGLTLGAIDGAMSQLAYLAAITAGLPLDAKGLGTGVWATPTAGYLIGFVIGACLAGYLAEKGFGRAMALRFVAGLAGLIVIYIFGAAWLTLLFLGGDWNKGWALGVQPFIVIDLAKAVIATALAEGLRAWLTRVRA